MPTNHVLPAFVNTLFRVLFDLLLRFLIWLTEHLPGDAFQSADDYAEYSDWHKGHLHLRATVECYVLDHQQVSFWAFQNYPSRLMVDYTQGDRTLLLNGRYELSLNIGYTYPVATFRLYDRKPYDDADERAYLAEQKRLADEEFNNAIDQAEDPWANPAMYQSCEGSGLLCAKCAYYGKTEACRTDADGPRPTPDTDIEIPF